MVIYPPVFLGVSPDPAEESRRIESPRLVGRRPTVLRAGKFGTPSARPPQRTSERIVALPPWSDQEAGSRTAAAPGAHSGIKPTPSRQGLAMRPISVMQAGNGERPLAMTGRAGVTATCGLRDEPALAWQTPGNGYPA